MTKKKQSLRWHRSCVKWLYLLGLGKYELLTRLEDLNRDLTDKNSDERRVAKMESQARYRAIRIIGDEKVIGNLDDEDLDETACHEVVHATMAPLVEFLDRVLDELPAKKQDTFIAWRNREVEEVTTHLTTTVRGLHRAPKGK